MRFRFCVVMHVLICIFELTCIATNSASHLVIFMHYFFSLHLRGVIFAIFMHGFLYLHVYICMHIISYFMCLQNLCSSVFGRVPPENYLSNIFPISVPSGFALDLVSSVATDYAEP